MRASVLLVALITVVLTTVMLYERSAGARFAFFTDRESSSTDLAAQQDAALEQRVQSELREIEATLAGSPPGLDLSPQRRSALMALDSIMRDPDASDRTAVQQFFHARIEHAVAEMARTQPESGATVWHIYNHGFVVRTRSVTLCFDLVRPRYLGEFALPRRLMERVIDACDVLFVSHVHTDHAERFVADTVIKKGKPVVAPEQVSYPELLDSKVTRLARDGATLHALWVRDHSVKLEVVVYPGHQGPDIDNNVVIVRTPEGVSIAHMGDQWDRAAFTWIDQVAKNHHVDILLPNDWTYDIARVVRGFNPALVIPGHANELGHEPAKRQPYMLSFERKRGSTAFGGKGQGYEQPLVILTWGEAYQYEPSSGAPAVAGREAPSQ